MKTKERLCPKAIFFLLLISILALTTCTKPEDNSINDTLLETTKIIDHNNWVNNFISIDSNEFTYTFKSSILNSVSLKVGDIIVISEGNGSLRKISNIDQFDNKIIISTTFASLNEAIKDGTLTFNTVLQKKNIHTITFIDKDKIVAQYHYKNGENSNIEASFDKYFKNDLVHLEGNFTLGPAINCELQIKKFIVEKFNIEYEVAENVELSAALEFLNNTFNEHFDLINIEFTPITVFVGPVPVILTPGAKITVGAEFNITSSVSTSLDQSMSYSVGVLYENNAWSFYNNFNNSSNFEPPHLNADANAKAYIKPEIYIKVYNTVSPYLYGDAYVRIEADLLKNPWWTLYAGFHVGAGVRMDIFGKEIFDWPTVPFYIISYDKPIANSSDVIVNQAPSLPSNPAPDNAEIDLPINTTLSWQCTDIDNDPLLYDIYFGPLSNPPLISSDLTVTEFDPGTLQLNTTYYWKIVSKDDHGHSTQGIIWHFTTTSGVINQPPSKPSDPNPINGELLVLLPVTLTWECFDPEGDPLTFDVYFGSTLDPAIAETNTSNFYFQPANLNPGTTYYWRIDAKDNHANHTMGDLWSFVTAPESDGLNAYYPFSGNTNDYSGNNYNGVNHGAELTTDRKGISNNAYMFNNDYIEIPSAALNNLGSGTVAAFIYLNATNSQNCIIDKTITGTINYFQFIVDENNKLRVLINTPYGTPGTYRSNTLLAKNNWYHVAVTWDGTKIRFYLNGQEDGVYSCTKGIPNVSSPTFIGKVENNTAYMNGKIDELRIYDHALSQSEIQEISNNK